MKHALSLLFIAAFSLGLSAQKYTVNSEESSMKLTGSSSAGTWTIDIDGVTGQMTVNESTITNAKFEVAIKSMKSGISAMDEIVYEKLNAEKNPNIVLTVKDVAFQFGSSGVKGEITVNDQTKPARISASIAQWSEKSVTVTGNMVMRLSDFGMEPVRSHDGGARTSDEMTLNFTLHMYR